MKKQISEVAKPTVAIKTSIDVLDWNEYYMPFLKDGYSKANSNFKNNATTYYENLNELAIDNVSYYDINMLISSRINLVLYDEKTGLLLQGDINENDRLLYFSMFTNNNYQLYGHLASTRNTTPSFKYYGYDGELIAGRYFNEDEIENGANKIIVYGDSQYYDGLNISELKVGDTLTYTLFKQSKLTPIISNGSIVDYDGENYKEALCTYDFEVIGIVESNSYFTEEEFKINLIPEKTFIKIVEDCYKYVGDDLSVGAISFLPTKYTLSSYDDLEEFVDKINNLSQFDLPYDYETNADKYISLFGDIDGIISNFKILFIFSFVSSLLILFFIMMFEINKRKKEIALLLSLGQSKTSVCIQFILEYLFMILVGLICALLCSMFIVDKISKNINLLGDVGFNISISFIQISLLFLVLMLGLLVVISISISNISRLNVRETMFDE